MIRFVLFLLIIYFIYAFYKAIEKNRKEPTIKDLGKAKVVNVATPCPDPKTFLDYIEGKIDGKQKEAMRKHIDSCEDCMSALQAVFDMPAKEELKK
ncbi:MAG: zf-HC2 domain-containing protein [Candidatus Orphnella occulta]|nr:zf-HC2 domain-containing protein [Candidatus Orphnella occulta]MDP8297290.1 zf-HC2 domain-containing protein [Candidatus Orphnella occulta]